MGKTLRETIHQNLVALVGTNPEVKKNRNTLVCEYWKQFNGAASLDDADKCVSAESIVREFRRLIEDGIVKLDLQSKIVLGKMETEFKLSYKKKGPKKKKKQKKQEQMSLFDEEAFEINVNV